MRNPFAILSAKVDRFKEATQSKEAFITYLEAPHAKGEDADHHNRWSNIDLAQSPPEDRKWTKWTYLAFWIANAAGVGNWTAGASLIALGLYPLDTWLCLATSHLWITFMILLNGRGPSRYHVGFPIMARSTYGMWGSYIVLGMRAVVCIVWNGTNSFYGGRLVSVAIGCIWPQWRTIPNSLPADAAITTTQLSGFIIFMAVFISLAFVHSRDLKPLYYIKSVYVGLAMHAVLIWFAVKTGGLSFSDLGSAPPTMSTTQRAWLCLQAFNVGLGTASSLSVNQGDMARYANKPNAQLWTTLIGYPIASALPCLYGILVAGATKKMTGKAIWNIWDTLELMLDSDPNNSGMRFLVFLLATAFALAYVALNLATNSLPFGSDVSAIFPRWMTIRRGQVIAAVLGVAIVPWKILNSAKAFVTFLSGYGYFLAAIAAVLSTDYFIIKKGNLKVRDLWVGDSSSRFWFYRGINYRAMFATFAGLVPCLPSFIATLQPNIGVSLGGQRMFYISFTLTYFIGGILYYLSYLIFPEKGLAIKERDLKFEQWADEMDEAERRNLAATAAEATAEEGDVDDKGDAAKDVETSNAKVYVLSNQ